MKVLLVEDDARDIDLTRRELARTAPHISLQVATTLGQARARLAEDTPCELILTDLALPDGSGLELVAEVRERALPLAVVVLTGADAAETAVAALKAGADDFLLKRDDYLRRLPGALDAALARFQAEAARRARPLHVLYAEDSEIDIDLTRRHLASYAPNIRLEVVFGVPELLARLPRTAAEPAACDVLLLDYRLAGADALEVLRTLRDERRLDLPVVLVTGQGDSEVAAQAFRFGAANYLVKHPGYLYALPAVLEAAHDRSQLVREQATLRESERRYRELVATVPGAVYTFRIDAAGARSMPFMSDGIGSMTGLSAAEVMADVDAAFGRIPAEALPAMEQSILASLLELSPWMHEFPIRTTSGEERWLRGQSRPRRQPDGATIWHGVFVDITDRKRVEQALQVSESNLRAVADNASVGILINFRQRHVFVNRHIAQMLGYTVEELLGTGLPEIIHPDVRSAVVDRFSRRLAGESVPQRYESVALRKDGTGVPVEITATITHWNGQPAGMAFMSDITERKRAEEALRLSEANLRAVADNASIGILISFLGHHVFANRHLAQMLGHTEEELLNSAVGEFIHPDARAEVMERFRRRMAGESVAQQYESVALRKDGASVPIEITAAITRWNGQPANMLFISDITERRRAEEALRESEERARLVFDQSPVTLLLATLPDGRIVEANDAFVRQFGRPREEAIGRTTVELGMWADPAARDRFIEEFARTGRLSDFENDIVRKDGESATVLMSGSVLKLKGQAYSLVSAIDITERKLTERALLQLSTGLAHKSGTALFEEIARRISDLLRMEIGFVCGLADREHRRILTLGLCIDGQAAAPVEYDLAGTPCGIVIGKQAALFQDGVRSLYPDDRFVVDLGVESYAAVPLFDSEGRALGHLGVMGRQPLRHPDRAERLLRLFAVRTAAEIERRREQTRFHDLFEFSPDAVILVDEQGCITLANRKAQTQFGYTREEFLELRVDDLVPQDHRPGHAATRRKYFSGAVPRSMGAGIPNLRAQRKDGTTFPADISLSPMHSDEGIVVVATVRDITERAQAEAQRQALEAQLFQAQKLEAVGTLSGGIAHDFNNILGAILGNVELARQDLAPAHPALESLDEIAKAGARARDLVQQILAFSRKQVQQRRAIALPPVIEEAVKLMRATLPSGIHLATAYSADAAKVPVLADSTQVHQVVMNLCTNAAHAMQGKPGRIEVALRPIELPDTEGESAGLPAGHYVELSVRDTGCGMDAATLEHIFEPFYTTRDVGEGTGLGLAVVHGIMQAHEGAVRVDSRPGEGSTFHLYFPALENEAQTAEPELEAPASGAGRGQHVLYVDDDESLVYMVTRMLERQGYRVSGHTWAKDALGALRADPHGFDLVVTDYNMPGMSGLDLAREVHAIRADLPVALISGYITDELRRKAAESGVLQLIYKPNTVNELCEAVRVLTSNTSRQP